VTGTGAPPGKTFDNAGFAALLALTTVATATGIDGILPLMPAIGAAFGATQAEVQLTLTAFMLGIAIGQLVHGPISDRFGRKPAILGGLVLNAVATAACAMATSIEMLMVFRFVHGIAASSGWLIARAVVRDRHERGEAARVISVMMVFHGMSPLIAPIVGAHLTVAYGWQAMFVFLSVYAVCVTGIFGTIFRETIGRKDPNALRPGPILRNFAEVSRSPSFWSYTACAAASYGILFAFLGTSSHVIITYFGETETRYSYMFAGCMVGSLAGMLMGARLVGRFGVDRLLRWGVGIATAFGLVLAGLAWASVDHWLAVIGPMLFCMISFAFIFPQSIAGALQPFPHIAGSASSLVGFMQQLIGAGTGVTVAALSDGTQLSLANGVLFWAVFGLVAYWAAVRKYRTV
tara:strand:+ start:3066 stop:4280 length:1215 start_codon:yes stop_codon:yes gene_type:complete